MENIYKIHRKANFFTLTLFLHRKSKIKGMKLNYSLFLNREQIQTSTVTLTRNNVFLEMTEWRICVT